MSGVQSIERAFALLRALAVGPAGITDLAERADLPKSTVARILGALEAEKAVEQEETGGLYRLGQVMADLAGVSPIGRNLIAAARPHLLQLTEVTGETSGISVLHGQTVRYLDHVESDDKVLVRSWTGDELDLHLVPSGLALLAGQPSEAIDNYLDRPLVKTTERTVIDEPTIRRRLENIRRDGYPGTRAEYDLSISSVAAPVLDAKGRTVAALHIHGPAFRFPIDEGAARDTARLVVDAAGRLSAQLS